MDAATFREKLARAATFVICWISKFRLAGHDELTRVTNTLAPY